MVSIVVTTRFGITSLCYGTSITTALGRIGANKSLIIVILIGYLTKDTKNIKKKEEDL